MAAVYSTKSSVLKLQLLNDTSAAEVCRERGQRRKRRRDQHSPAADAEQPRETSGDGDVRERRKREGKWAGP